jgi:molecular chaperone GrpE
MGEHRMTDPSSNGPSREEGQPEDVADLAPEQDAGDAAEAAADEDPQAALEAAREEAERYRDAALRAQAEVDNVRRRTTREVENAHKYALEKFAGQLLPVVDSLEKSVEEVERHAGSGEAFDAIREGIELSQKLFRDTLERFGIEQVNPVGEPFDPDLHEAMSMIEAPSAEPSSVVDVLQKGYTLNGRLLRAAMVIVAKAPANGGNGDRAD